jgi:hypothetical protein
MKTPLIFLTSLLFLAFTSCNKNEGKKVEHERSTTEGTDAFYFNYSIDGTNYKVAEDDILTTYNEFSATQKEFKIFAGKDQERSLVLTIISDMSKPSTTPNGSAEPGNALSHGSVSLQNFPEKGFTFNSYDFLLNPKPAVIPNAITITKSEAFEDNGRIITGTIDAIVRGGENKQNDPKIKDYTIKGNFRVKHLFQGGLKF